MDNLINFLRRICPPILRPHPMNLPSELVQDVLPPDISEPGARTRMVSSAIAFYAKNVASRLGVSNSEVDSESIATHPGLHIQVLKPGFLKSAAKTIANVVLKSRFRTGCFHLL